VLLLVGLLIWAGVGNFFERDAREANAFIPDNAVRLGLDLQGGAHIVIGPDLEGAVQNELGRLEAALLDRLTDDGVTGVRTVVTGGVLKVQPAAESDADTLRTLLGEDFTILDFEEVEATAGSVTQFNGTLIPDEEVLVRDRAIEQVLEVLRRRLEDPQTGIAESVVTKQGSDRVLVQIPGVDRIPLKLLGSTGLLEFKIVEDVEASEELLLQKYADGLPEGKVIALQIDEETERVLYAYLVSELAPITGQYLEGAQSRFDPNRNEWAVDFSWDGTGADIFGALTEANIDQPLAILLDGEVYSAPNISSRISRNGQITGGFSSQEAADLAIILRAGSLPIDIEVLEERTIGPALGQDSIDAGLAASATGLLVVVIFVGFYFKLSGVYTGIGLAANLIMLMGLLSMFEATLTVPGIAGLVLTVGMAVDGNVIIFERIREELRSGRAPRAAIATGFSKARNAILDANITTLLTAIILFQYGTGPIKGFAVTLSVGILTSVFSALVITRLLYEWKPGQANVTELSI
jgi:preprotein translocase subunit SecD